MVTDIRVLALDIDGVVTDGTTTLSNSGDEGKRVSFLDLDAVTQAKRAGLKVVLITGEDGPSVDAIARRFSVDAVRRGAKDKLAVLQELSRELAISLDEMCYVGDGDRDAEALASVGLGLAPNNATPAAKAAAHRVLSQCGGSGAIAESVALLHQLQANAQNAEQLEKDMAGIVRDSLNAHERLLDESLPVLARIAQTLVRTIRSGHKILLFGNGGSAADAQHVAAELVGRFSREREPWPAIALTTDTSILTAVGNDWEFADIFARQVRALAKPKDVVVGISTSGRSANVLRGLEAGRTRGAIAVALTGMPGGRMHEYADLCFRVPATSTPRIQELHLLSWHAICELVETELTHPSMASSV
jgi:D-sedoheptulose 7-phosphate isomerase